MSRGIGHFPIPLLLLLMATGAGGAEYTLGPDSLPQEGVPSGTVEERTWDASRIYPGHDPRVPGLRPGPVHGR